MVIAHPDTQIGTVSKGRLRQIYLNRSKKWSDGGRIHLTILANTPTTVIFMDKYLGKSCTQFDRYWKRQLFSGKGIPPEYFSSLKDLLDYIRNTKGAIGFIDSDIPPEGVSILKLVE